MGWTIERQSRYFEDVLGYGRMFRQHGKWHWCFRYEKTRGQSFDETREALREHTLQCWDDWSKRTQGGIPAATSARIVSFRTYQPRKWYWDVEAEIVT